MKIVWIESDSVFLNIHANRLRELGYDLEVVNSISEGLKVTDNSVNCLVVYDRSFEEGCGVADVMPLVERCIPLIEVSGIYESGQQVYQVLPEGHCVYLKRPVQVDEFLYAIRTFQGGRESWLTPYEYKIGVLQLNERCRQVITSDGSVVDLTLSEMKILRTLAFQPGRVFPTSYLRDVVGSRCSGVGNTVQVHVRNIRRKIGAHYIRTVRGSGYSFHRIQ